MHRFLYMLIIKEVALKPFCVLEAKFFTSELLVGMGESHGCDGPIGTSCISVCAVFVG